MASPRDIVVVGAGVIGCAVACELARRGAAVALLDDRPVGMGATQASAGVLAPYIEATEGSPLLDLTTRSLELFDAFLAQTAADSGLEVQYQRGGTLDVALHDDTMQRFRSTAAVLARRGVEGHLLDGDAVRREEPHLTADVRGGLLIPSHGFVAAAHLTRALAAAAVRRGAQVGAPARVRRLSAGPSGILVELDHGSLNANRVVLAAGSWSGRVEIEGVTSPVPVRPVRGQLLQLAWPGTPLRRVTWGERCYLVPWQDGTLLVGATVEEAGFDERATAAGVRDLLDAACELVPQAWTATFVSARVGLRPGSPDDLPVIGFSSRLPHLMYATGHYRNGVLLAPLTAQLVADALLLDRVDPLMAATAPGRFGNL